MLTDPIDIQKQLHNDGLKELSDHWTNLGALCTLWSGQGQLIGPLPASSSFWMTLWNHGRGFRSVLSALTKVESQEHAHAKVLQEAGLYVRAHKIHAGYDGIVLIVCLISDRCSWGEGFERACSHWQLDAAALKQRGEKQLRFSEQQAARVFELIRLSYADHFNLVATRTDTEEMTEQLTSAYEELNLIYRIGATMRVTELPREHFRRLFEDLAKTTPITTMAAVLNDTEVLDSENRLLIGGEPIVDEAGVLKVVDNIEPLAKGWSSALVINDISEHTKLDWAASWLERLIAVPIICNQTNLGVLLAFNQRGNLDFNSTDVRLLHSVVDRSAVYLENVLLYGDLNKLLMGLMHALVSSIDAKDPYTCGHSNRVALISRRIAEQAPDPPMSPERVYLSGLLHDIGKIGISELILCKPGRLAEEERNEMRKHPEIGARILGGIRQLDDVIPAVLHHHEWINGTGYPKGLSDEDIPWVARIVGIADAFDAMTTGRTYRSALPLASAMAEIRRFSGTQFSPQLVDALIELVDGGLVDELKRVKKVPAFDNVYTKWTRKSNLP